jgi:GMP synthase-like glutamine amidotransferase
MRILVFQHVDVEHPGVFREFLATDGIRWDVCELDAGDRIPKLEQYDALWVMGGPMDVWEESEHPWLIPEKAAIRHAVSELRMPYLGVCLGHQLLGDALGGHVGKASAPEVGVLPVQISTEGMRDPLFEGIEHAALSIDCLQWHGAAVLEPPQEATVLAHSPLCAVQAMRIGTHAYGIQFHVEATDETVPQWAAIPEYKAALEHTLGVNAASSLQAQTEAKLPIFRRNARKLYDNFMRMARTNR